MRVPISFDDYDMRNWARQNTLLTDETYLTQWITPGEMMISANITTTIPQSMFTVLQFPTTDESAYVAINVREGWAAGRARLRMFYAPSNTNTGEATVECRLHYKQLDDTATTLIGFEEKDITMSGVEDKLAVADFAMPAIGASAGEPQQSAFKSIMGLRIKRIGTDPNDTFTGNFEFYGALFTWQHARET